MRPDVVDLRLRRRLGAAAGGAPPVTTGFALDHPAVLREPADESSLWEKQTGHDPRLHLPNVEPGDPAPRAAVPRSRTKVELA